MPFLTAIFVNYRTAELTIRAIAALLAELERLGDHRVIVVDNDSADGSFEELNRAAAERGWRERVSILAAPRNGGYGYGINLAVRHALATTPATEYVYVINTDAFAAPGTLGRLLAFMESHADAGLAGGRIRRPDGGTQGAAFRFPSVLSEIEQMAAFSVVSRVLRRHAVVLPVPPADQEVDWLPGTSMVIRRAVFDRGVYFDEGFFLYFEEVDFARRLRAAGFRAYFVADAPVDHLGSVSTGLGEVERRLPDYWFDSRHRYFRKHHSATYAVAADVGWMLGYAIFRAKRAALGQSGARRPRLLRDFLRASARGHLRAAPARPPGAADDRRASELGLGELVREDFATCGRDPLDPGLWAVVVHRLASRSRAVSSPRLRGALGRALAAASTGVERMWGIHVPAELELGRRVRLRHGGGGMSLNARAIGADATLAHGTTLGPLRAGEAAADRLPVIEDGVELGPGVAVLGPVTVGRRAVVLANSVVLRDVAPESVVVGVPARAAGLAGP